MKDDGLSVQRAQTPTFFSVSNGRSSTPSKAKATSRVVEPPKDSFEFVEDHSDAGSENERDDGGHQRNSKEHKQKKTKKPAKLVKSTSIKQRKKKSSTKSSDLQEEANTSFGFGDFDDEGSLTKSPTPDDSFESLASPVPTAAAVFDDSFTNGGTIVSNNNNSCSSPSKGHRKSKKDGSSSGAKKKKSSDGSKDHSPRTSSNGTGSSGSRKLMTMQPLTKQKSGRISPQPQQHDSFRESTSPPGAKSKTSSSAKMTLVPTGAGATMAKQKSLSKIMSASQKSLSGSVCSSNTNNNSSSSKPPDDPFAISSMGADDGWTAFPDPAMPSPTATKSSSNASPLRGNGLKNRKSFHGSLTSTTTTTTDTSQSTTSPMRSPGSRSKSHPSPRRMSMTGRVNSPTSQGTLELDEAAKADTKKSRRRSYIGGKDGKDDKGGKVRSKSKTSNATSTAKTATVVRSNRGRPPPRELFTILDIEPWSSENTTYSDLELMEAIEADPESVKKKYRFEFFGVVIYPFSMMCAIGSSLAAIQMCHDVFPEAMHEKDPWVGSPLHYACGYEGPLDVVKWLMEEDAGMITTLNRLKRSPFHIACQFNPRSEVLDALLRTAPTGLEVRDKYGCTPLHLACENNAPVEVLEMMVDRYPLACTTPSSAGATPLHLALENRVPLHKIKPLVKGQEESVLSIRDVEGRTPLHTAVENECDAKMIKFLVRCYPESLNCTTEWLNETPIQMAQRLDGDDEVIAVLRAERSRN